MEIEEKNQINQLFRRIAIHDDEDAFRSLFLDFFSPLCVFAHRYIENWETCEDVVQDTFFKIWKNRKTIEINTSGRNFLVTGVRNGCIDYLRKKETEMSWLQKDAFNAATAATDTEELYTTAELEELLNKSLARLPENIRQVFEQSRFEGKTYAEIAAERNISIKTVEAYMTKALKQLRVDLKDYLPLFLLFL
ncbi:MAG: RNA polymerase sigma-70 factor [Tannerella sp.]|jgi:RNA polymerase sigma-70 factor (ECF subfamily)|nr:RNA polymerase sigma-70 factor [Tannerella sp.]